MARAATGAASAFDVTSSLPPCARPGEGHAINALLPAPRGALGARRAADPELRGERRGAARALAV